MRNTCLVVLLFSGICSAQIQPSATPDELQYLRFLLLNVASLDHHPAAVKSFEDMLVKQFGQRDSDERCALKAMFHGIAKFSGDSRRNRSPILI